MITIVCSTNRKNSISKTIAKIYNKILDGLDVESQILDLSDLPGDFTISALYDKSGENEVFNQLAQKMTRAKKFVFIVPEYSGSFPGVLKAFIDGLPFPDSFNNKKCALVGLSTGVQGGGLALSHLTDIFNYCGMHVLALKPKLSNIDQYLSGNIISNKLYMELLEEQAQHLVDF